MSEWAIGLSTGCFYQKSIFECVEGIASSGFSRIEVCSSPAHLDYHDLEAVHRAHERLDSAGIVAHSFHAPFADHIDITSPDESRRGRATQEVLTAIEAAAILQARYFVIHPGPEQAGQPGGAERSQRIEHVAAELDRIASRCQQLGMTCVLENKLPHLMFGNLPDISWILGAMTTKQVGVCLDTGHAHLAGDLWNVAQGLAGHLRVIHASDNKGRGDDHLPPGDGEIDWMRLFQQLRANGFAGAVILEIAGRGEFRHILASAERARGFLEGIFKGV